MNGRSRSNGPSSKATASCRSGGTVSPAPEGRPLEAPGVSVLRYAGEGKFDYELDLLNMAEVGELMEASDWRPNASLNAPPTHPDRNVTPPG
jgi:hypothetical protein